MKILRITVLAFFVLVVALSAQAAEYAVKQGDTLTKISRMTGHSLQQLAQMNSIENPDLIFPGQKIVFISEDDLELAGAWCKERMKKFNPLESSRVFKNYMYFSSVLRDIENKHLSYSLNESAGTYFSIILDFSEAWQKEHWQTETSDSPHHSKVYWIEGCVICTFKDGNGALIYAKDPDYHRGELTQTIRIRRYEESRLKIEKHYDYFDRGSYWFLSDEYDVFYVKYRERAKKLPESVKKMFFGCYGFGDLSGRK